MGCWKLHDIVTLRDDVKNHPKCGRALMVLHALQLRQNPLIAHPEQIPHGIHQRFISSQIAPFFLFSKQLDPYAHFSAIKQANDFGVYASELLLKAIERDVCCSL